MLYPYFIHPLYTIIKRDIAYIQITLQNANALQILKKCPRQAKLLPTLDIFIAK